MSEFDKKRYICPACGKEFLVACRDDEWGFAYDRRLTCSYHCMREMEHADKRKLRSGHPAASLYRRMMLGKKSGELVYSMTAKKERLRSKEEVRAFVDDWVKANPREAQQIREEAQIQLTNLRMIDVAGIAGVGMSCVRKRADRLGITGRKIASSVYYTQAEADAIIAALGVTA